MSLKGEIMKHSITIGIRLFVVMILILTMLTACQLVDKLVAGIPLPKVKWTLYSINGNTVSYADNVKNSTHACLTFEEYRKLERTIKHLKREMRNR